VVPGSKRVGALLLSACVLALLATSAGAAEDPPHPASLDEAIIKSAARHGIPESLVRRVVMRESKYNPLARNHKYWGLMQISYPTAKSMGFKGTPQELLNPVVNLRYAVPYLANAFIIAGKRQDAAVRLYAAGYYDTAKRRGLLGLMRTANSTPLSGVADEPDQVANLTPAPPPQPEDTGIFGALFGPRQMPREEQPQVASADPQQAVAVAQPAAAPAAPLPPTRAAGATRSASATDDTATGDVTLVADKNGKLQPPKKWLHDGGSTVIACGEQPIERIAAFKGEAGEKSARGRHHKTTLFAAIDAPPATAQAYAGQDQRLMQADSQAAIAQATSGQPVAQAATTAAAMAPDAQQQQALAEQPQGQPAPQQVLDASGYPADAGSRPAESADAAPTKKKRHVAHHARPHKTALAQDDSKAQPATTPH
jgi:Transglycosylase SLT domain